MRIIYITASLPYGGGEAFLIAEINELVRLGHEVLVLPRSPGSLHTHAGELLAPAHREPLFSGRVLRCAAGMWGATPRRVRRIVSRVLRGHSMLKNLAVIPKALWLADFAVRWGAAHLHCHWAGTTATLAMMASELSGIPWSFTAHRWDIVENNLFAGKAGSASFVRFISDDGMRMAREMGITLGDNARVIRMGVAIPDCLERASARPPVVLCPANLVKIKGHCDLIEAFRIVRDRGIAGELWLAGDGELRAHLLGLVQAHALSGAVKFLGARPHQELLRLYRTQAVATVALASIDMGPGEREGIPVALVEAMSHGIPVIATATGGIPELVLPGTGLLVPPRDPVALAAAMAALLQNGDFAVQLGLAGQRRAAAVHDVRRIAAAMVASFDLAASQHRPSEIIEPLEGPKWRQPYPSGKTL